MHPPKVQSPRPTRLWWCNADFDLTLAHGGGKMPAKILEAAGAMAWPMWPALASDDALCVPVAPPGGFREYLDSLGLTPPRFVTSTSAEAEARPESLDLFTPFGWNAEAVRRNALRPNRTPHPSLDVVRRVNSRAFSFRLEHSLFGESACPAWYCPTARAVIDWLSAASPGSYLAKGNHGLAGIGQLRFKIGGESDTEGDRSSGTLSQSLERLASRHGGLVVEKSLEIDREWGLLFRLARDGRISSVRRHRLLSTDSGGYAGAIVLPHDVDEEEWNPHREKAREAVDKVAEALRAEGYFGPVGLDMFRYGGGVKISDGFRFRPLVDLNARQSMAWPAHGLAARFPDRTILFRQLPASGLNVPSGYPVVPTNYDKLSFNSIARRGAIWITPLLPLSRVSFAIVGDDERDVLRLQDELLGLLSR